MSTLARYWRSSIGGKLVTALSGLLLLLFLIAHLSGNLLVFKGQDAMNAYALWLREQGPLLWVMRLGLLLVAVVHILTAARLHRENRRARPEPYARRDSLVSSAAARSMMLTGAALALYTLFHLAHLTWGLLLTDFARLVDAQGRHDVYTMVVKGFQQWYVTALYVASMVVLGLHLSHGVTSFFQTLGLNHPRYNPVFEKAGPVLGFLLAAGYIAIPCAVLAGFVQEAPIS